MAPTSVLSAATSASVCSQIRPSRPIGGTHPSNELAWRIAAPVPRLTTNEFWLRDAGTRHTSVHRGLRLTPHGRIARRSGRLVGAAYEGAVAAQGARGARAMAEGERPEDAAFMRRALELSRQAVGRTSPNPLVGCVIVKDGAIVGEGWHPKAGEPHAEVFALRAAGKAASGATAYVTLEPCNHHGRTPPCSQALVKARVKRVVVGTSDPNPLVGGQGIRTLRKAGIEVVVGVEEEACRRNVEAFMFRITNQRPYSVLRYSLSLSGSLLPSIGTSGCAPGSYRSQLLAEYDAAVVTDTDLLAAVAAVAAAQATLAGSSDADDASPDGSPSPASLLSSEPDCQQPLRVVIARSLAHLPRSAPVFDTSLARTLVVTDGSAVAADVTTASATGEPAAEEWLREAGVDLVVLSDGFSPSEVMELCLQRDCNSVLWDWHPVGQGMAANSSSSGDAGDGASSDIQGWSLGNWLVEDEAVEKVVVALSPVLGGNVSGDSGSRSGWLEGDVGDLFPLQGLRAHVCGEDVIVEGYVMK